MDNTDKIRRDEETENIILNTKAKIAYFSMEIGIEENIPTYSGGLGILAGDTLKSCADLSIPVVGVTLLSEKGYFHQKIDEHGNQIELPVSFTVEDVLKPLPKFVTVYIENREVKIRAWLYQYEGINNYKVPIIFLDTNIESNSQWDREITKFLYGGDERYRLAQEIVLGIGGIRMLDMLGYEEIDIFHMNEGHAALSTIELFSRFKDIEKVREKCVFTTHTPVAAGHDQFEIPMAKSMIGDILPDSILDEITLYGKLNMTKLALFFSHYINGVAKKHGEISRMMFPGYSIDSITNGVHAATWTCSSFKKLFDKYIPGWRSDTFMLRSAFSINPDEIWNAHMESKKTLIDFINYSGACDMNTEDFTIGFARRQTAYKRPDLLISNPDKLIEISKKAGPIQIIYSGKAHPRDYSGKEAIKKICGLTKELNKDIKMYFVPNYDISIAKMMVSGVDLWLNTPQRPNEASGTSGMKAACNGVPQLGTLDGWWIEGCIENITGWSIGPINIEDNQPSDYEVDSKDLYNKLENKIIPKFYNNRDSWVKIMRRCIAINGSFFNTNRMVQQYVLNAYFK
jgi:starch phosphorylase